MPEMIAVGTVCFVLGLLVGGCMAYDKGWRAGVAWAQARLFGG